MGECCAVSFVEMNVLVVGNLNKSRFGNEFPLQFYNFQHTMFAQMTNRQLGKELAIPVVSFS